MYKHKNRCLKCKYGWFPVGMQNFLGTPMCLYFHDTAKHRDGDDDTCNSFKELTEKEIEKRRSEGREQYERNRAKTYY